MVEGNMNAQNSMPIVKHDVAIKGRRHIDITGVREVISFDETAVVMSTDGGEMTLEGNDLRIGVLDTERGIVSVEGKINALFYDEDAAPSDKKRFFGRIFK
jgi:sporulation protein YabP